MKINNKGENRGSAGGLRATGTNSETSYSSNSVSQTNKSPNRSSQIVKSAADRHEEQEKMLFSDSKEPLIKKNK